MALYGDLNAILVRLNDVWGYEHPDNLAENEPVLLGLRAQNAIDIPPLIQQFADRLHELGTAGNAAQRCIYALRRARDLIGTQPSGRRFLIDPKAFYDYLWKATVASGTALNQIDDMFATPVGGNGEEAGASGESPEERAPR